MGRVDGKIMELTRVKRGWREPPLMTWDTKTGMKLVMGSDGN